ncbi:MAG: hypothetical protein IPI64_15550 [Chloracidobacterium sp.]|nr:hypothetical protein [Chloracidobacterium sp.]
MRSRIKLTITTVMAIAAIIYALNGWGQPSGAKSLVNDSLDARFDSCQNVSFIVWNVGPGPVEIKKIKYYNRTDGKWKTEDTPNKTCARNVDCKFGWDNLGSAEGDDLTKIVLCSRIRIRKRL